jgi:tRNA1(Val) A37 N6-methylase TrmN6
VLAQSNPLMPRIKHLKEYKTEVEKMKKWQDKTKQNAEIVLNKVKTDSSVALIQMCELINYHNQTPVYDIYYDPKTYHIVSVNKVEGKDIKKKN